MPANLTSQYLSAEEKYKKSSNDFDRIEALKEMLAVIPKHKGTEKLQGEIRRKIAKIKKEIQRTKSKKTKKNYYYSIEREGAAQAVIIGPPNSGKTYIINSLTNAHFEVAPYPFTTHTTQVGMMKYEDIQIQLVDLPALSDEHFENWVIQIIKNADLLLLVVDISKDNLLDKIEMVFTILEKNKINIYNGDTVIKDNRYTTIKGIIIGNKIDIENSEEKFSVLKEFLDLKYPLYKMSAKENIELNHIKHAIYKILNLVRIYSKRPGHDADFSNPYTFMKGSTLLDFARVVHKDFIENLKFARVWGQNTFNGQRVHRDYILQDKDIIELHM